MTSTIDITYNFERESAGKDPDKYSPTLRTYHKRLWSKPLPNGTLFNLVDTTRHAYLHHESDSGEFFLTSDTLNQSYGKTSRMRGVRAQIPEEVLHFRTLMYTIGNMIIFPGRRINGKRTINQARGCSIGDRCDLTLECIRRHYRRDSNPLADDLMRYESYFHLFGSFAGYVDFFLLNDLVTADCSAVNFFLPFTDFGHLSSYPNSVTAFTTYLRAARQFIAARNDRILEFSRGKN